MIDKMPEFISEIINDETIGKKGYLAHGGLVPLTNVEAKKVRKRVSKRLNLGGK